MAEVVSKLTRLDSPTRNGVWIALAAGVVGALVILGVGGDQPDLAEMLGVIVAVAGAAVVAVQLTAFRGIGPIRRRDQDKFDDRDPLD